MKIFNYFFNLNIKIISNYKKLLLNLKILFLIIIFLINIFNINDKKNIIIKKYYKFISNNSLLILSKNKKDPIRLKEKLKLLEFLSQNSDKKIRSVKYIFISLSSNFGNNFLHLNKVIFFCEILGCKRIIVNPTFYWYIKNKIYDINNKMIIETGEESKYKNKGLIIDYTSNFFYYVNYIKPEFRVNLLKNEIFKNIPAVKIKQKDLFIYIRSGDIFYQNPHLDYSQPPLCFYKKILNNYKFNNIYIISKDKYNPNINILLNTFPNIIFNKNPLKLDISYLCKAYNIVGAPSTFFFTILQINNNIKFLWDFSFQHHKEYRTKNLDKLFNFFYIPKKNITIYRMISSVNYTKEMIDWKCTKKQIDLMINSNCPYNFSII